MIKKTAWNTARVQTDNLKQRDAKFCWGAEKIIRKMLKGVQSLLPVLFRVNSASFHDEKKKLKSPSLLPFLTIILLAPTSPLVIMDDKVGFNSLQYSGSFNCIFIYL